MYKTFLSSSENKNNSGIISDKLENKFDLAYEH